MVLENNLEEVKAQEEILLSMPNEPEKAESEPTDSESQEDRTDSNARQDSTSSDFKKIIYNAIISGKLQKMLEKVVDGMDLTKVALRSLADIIDKTKDKLEGNVDEVPGPMGMPIMTDMWLPMFLSLLQTQEFQHLLANMFAQLVKDG